MSDIVSADIKREIDKSVLCWLATVDAQGWPNVSPKEIFCTADGQTLLIAHIASPQSVRNIQSTPQVCVSVIDIFRQKGYKLKGKATIIEPSSLDFAATAAPLEAMVNGAFTIRAVIKVTIHQCLPIVAPSYWAYPEVSEKQMIAQAKARYAIEDTD